MHVYVSTCILRMYICMYTCKHACSHSYIYVHACVAFTILIYAFAFIHVFVRAYVCFDHRWNAVHIPVFVFVRVSSINAPNAR